MNDAAPPIGSHGRKGRPNFSLLQRQELKQLGVLDPQVEYLRQRLVSIRAWRTRGATLTDVRAEFAALKRGLEEALLTSLRVLNSLPTNKALSELHSRLANATVDTERQDYPLEDLCAHLKRELELIRVAELNIGTSPRRLRSASIQPIVWIEGALQHGWAEAHLRPPLQDGIISLTGMPPYPFHVSRNGDFARIAGICFEASAGVEDSADGFSPEASIKAYLRFETRRKSASRSG